MLRLQSSFLKYNLKKFSKLIIARNSLGFLERIIKLIDIIEYYSKISLKYEVEEYYLKNPLNHFWGNENTEIMRSIITSAKTKLDVIHGAQKTFMFSVNTSDESKQYAVDWLLAEQSQRGIDLFSLPASIQESKYSYQDNNVLRNGRLLNPDFIRTVNICMEIKKYVQPHRKNSVSVEANLDLTFALKDDEKLNVIELGAGLGHLARTLKLFGISGRHIIIDLPETLVFSYCFLTENFPDARVLLVSDAETGDEDFSMFDFILVPTIYKCCVLKKNYDLFINTASLGEMRNTDIFHWMDFIQNKLSVRYLFTLNRYLNTVNPALHEWRFQENECSVHYDKQWNILQWELEPSFTRSPYVDTLVARYVEIVAERLEVLDEVACSTQSRNLLARVKQQDWYRFEDIYPSVMTSRDNILVHDMKMTGTLFMLWESIRLNTTVEAIALLLQYMHTLLRLNDVEFEEHNYYVNLFFRLYDPVRDIDLQTFAKKLQVQLQKRKSANTKVELVQAFNGYNLVKVSSRFIAVLQAIGNVELMVERLGERDLPPFLLTGDSLENIKLLLLNETEADADRQQAAAANERSMAVVRELEAQLTLCKSEIEIHQQLISKLQANWAVRIARGIKQVVGCSK